MQLKLLNLPRNINENDLKQMFGEYGDVLECTLVKDAETGESKGFGFIEMGTVEAGQSAIESLHKKKVKGSRIRVKSIQ